MPIQGIGDGRERPAPEDRLAVRLCTVRAGRGNTFMHELLDVVADTARDLGVEVIDAVDSVPDHARDTAYVLVPHEYFETTPPHAWLDAEQRRRTIAFCTEHPGTPWYEISVRLTAALAAAVDINKSAAAESRRRGVPAEHFQLGYFRKWDRWGGAPNVERPIDVLYLGSADDRRAQLLAAFGTVLWRHRCQLLISPIRPKTEARLDYLIGASKWDRMRDAKVLINLHRGASRALEWHRVLEAICNGCVVVTENSDDLEHLIPGRHLVSADPASVGLLVDHLLGKPDALGSIRDSAYEFVRTELPVQPAVERLLSIAESLVRHPRRPSRSQPALAASASRRRRLALRAARLVREVAEPASTTAATAQPPAENDYLRAAVKHLIIETSQLRRQLQAIAVGLDTRTGGELTTVTKSPAYELARPRVSVVIPLYNYQREVRDALASLVASDFDLLQMEIVVVDDASTDASLAMVREFIDRHPWVPAMLLRHPVNRGLGVTRNTGASNARAEYLLMLDADNKVFPTAIARLAAALDSDREASFAYPIIAQHQVDGPSGLLSMHTWDPSQLREGNYIDALALIRRQHLLRLQGYADDPRLLGWEDYDLWCRLADAGRHGVLVPEILAWYRKNDHSMISLTNVDTRIAQSLVRARSPRLMGAKTG